MQIRQLRWCLVAFLVAWVLALVITMTANADARADSMRKICVRYDFPKSVVTEQGAQSLKVLAYGQDRERRYAKLRENTIEKMEEADKDNYAAYIDIDPDVVKLYMVYCDDHYIITSIHAKGELIFDDIRDRCNLEDRTFYQVSLPLISLDKTQIAVGEMVVATLVAEDGYLHFYTRSGNEDILGACQNPLDKKVWSGDCYFGGRQPGEMVVQIFLDDGQDSIFAGCSEMVTVTGKASHK